MLLPVADLPWALGRPWTPLAQGEKNLLYNFFVFIFIFLYILGIMLIDGHPYLKCLDPPLVTPNSMLKAKMAANPDKAIVNHVSNNHTHDTSDDDLKCMYSHNSENSCQHKSG